MNILITGIAGFFGQNLSRVLLAQGHTVYGVDDLSVGKKEWLHHDVHFLKCDLKDAYESDRIARHYLKIDIIIHLASRKIPRDGLTIKTLEENVRMMAEIIYLANRFGSRIIFFSTSDVYGQQQLFDEEAFSRIGHPSNPRWSYAITKMWCEQYLFANDIPFVILRIFGSYGPYHALNWTAGPQSVFISQALKGESFTIHGTGDQTRCFSYVDDIVDGVLRVIKSDYNREIFNLGNPTEEVSILNLATMINNLIRPEKDTHVTFSPSMGKNFADEDVLSRKPIITKARRMLDWEPKTSLLDGLKKTIEWQKTVVV